MEILDGKSFSNEIKAEVKAKVEKYFKEGSPLLACIIVEGDKASETYVASKQKACEVCGLKSMVCRLTNDTSQEKLEEVIKNLNSDEKVDAILLQLPLPKHLDARLAINKISPDKDVDCLTNENLGAMLTGSSFAPCTASGIIKLLERYNINLEGKNAVVIGRSLLVGKSVASLLEHKNATVTLCHSKTKNLKEITNSADILIVAIGKPLFITSGYVKEGAIVIDVGINRIDGKIKGDVDYENVKNKCAYITPVPGGVGPLTVACLMENTLHLALKKQKIKLSK